MAFFAASQDPAQSGPPTASDGTPFLQQDVNWAEEVAQGICRPGCNSDIWIAHDGGWCPGVILKNAGSHFVQVPPAKPGTIYLGDEGEWQNITIFNKDCMVRASGQSQDAGTVRGSDGHQYWKVVRTWTSCEIGDPKNVNLFLKMPFEHVVADDGSNMLDAEHRSFSLVRWVRRAEDGVVAIFENNPANNPEQGWDFSSNPARLLAVSQSTPLPGQHPALVQLQQLQPPPPSNPPPNSM